MYRRVNLTSRNAPESESTPELPPATVGANGHDAPPELPARAGLEVATESGPSGVIPGAIAVLLLAIVVYYARHDIPVLPRILVPVIGLCAVLAVAPMLQRRHPDEPWLTKFLVWGVLFKILAAALRYRTLVDSYGNVGDASGYDLFARKLLNYWQTGQDRPMLADRRKTNFLRWFTAIEYKYFGEDMIAGFFVFGLLAFIGSYLWYRAVAEAIPFVNRRMFCALLFFAPSVAFWPSSIGKEALMQLGFGSMALGIAHLLRHRLLRAFLVASPGAWLLWVVRPHLLALAMAAATIAYLAARSPKKMGASANASLLRPVGIILVSFLAIFAASSAAQFFGMKDLSLTSIETELNYTTGQSEQGGSQFDSGNNSLSPLRLPQGVATVLLRPWPWEVDSPYQLLASLESFAFAFLILQRFSSVTTSLTRWRLAPFLLYAWVLLLLYAATFSSFANFGLLVRQRSLVLPAMFVILSIDAAAARRIAEEEEESLGASA
jgi:hypothetical protein